MSDLRDFASPTQLAALEAVDLYGSARAAERALKLGHDVIGKPVRRLKAKAARMGHAPGHWASGVAEGYLMGKVTVQRGRSGSVERTWERQSPDQLAWRQAMEAAAAAMRDDIGRLDPLAPPMLFSGTERLLNLYTITDAHVGMLAWRKEGGEDWDLAIAEDTLTRSFQALIAGSPAAEVGVVNQLGDFLHYDGLMPVTPTSGHVLDSDGRFSKMVGVAVRVLRRIIDAALAKHARVIVVLAEGNHDMASSVWLRHMFRALYENEPRIEIIDSELPYYAIQHGNVMLAFHHGHLKKPDEFPLVFAAQFPKVWGNATHRYAHAGHQHHLYRKEHGGMIVTQHQTLAARDAYASRGAWFSNRGATSYTYHTEYGEVATNTISPEMLH